MLKFLRNQSFWASYMLLTLLLAFFLSWHISAKANFLYPLWHDVIDIEQTVKKYGPLNRYRENFQLTDKAERTRLFAGIVEAIHDDSDGLESLVYHAADGRALGPLLTRPEVVHLQDVARLLRLMDYAGYFVLMIWLLFTGWIVFRNRVMPRMLSMLGSGLAGVLSPMVIVLVLGPVKVFYQFHEWVFPKGNQWFFYYEDSLLTMMMKAPVLFGPIAVMLVVIALLLCILSLWGVRMAQNRRGSTA